MIVRHDVVICNERVQSNLTQQAAVGWRFENENERTNELSISTTTLLLILDLLLLLLLLPATCSRD